MLVQAHRLRTEVEILYLPFPLKRHIIEYATRAGAPDAPPGNISGNPSENDNIIDKKPENEHAGDADRIEGTVAKPLQEREGEKVAVELNLPENLHSKVLQDTEAQRLWEGRCLAIEQLPAVLDACAALSLDKSFGYITLIRQFIPSATEMGLDSEGRTLPECLRGSESSLGWVISDVTFGVPIFDAALNRAVCHRIVAMQLLAGTFTGGEGGNLFFLVTK